MLRYLSLFSVILFFAQNVQAASSCYVEEGDASAIVNVADRTYILNPGRSLFCSLDAAGTVGPNLYFNKCSKLHHQLVAAGTCGDSVSVEMCTDEICTQSSVVTGAIGPAVGSTDLVSRFGRLVNANQTCAATTLLYCAP